MTTRISRLLQLSLLACIVVLASSCGLFDTREAEKPTTGSSKFVPPTAPDLVLENLKSAISEMNTENYLRCLVDTLNSSQRFQFIPTTSAAGRYPMIFSFWSLQSERSYFSSMKALTTTNSTSVLNLTGGFTVIASDSAVYNGDYQLTIKHGIAGVSETVRGNVQFVITSNRNSFWSIYHWTDNPITNETSWSEWKGRFAN